MANDTFAIESLVSCRNLCIGKNGDVYTLPNDDAQHNQDCRFSHNKEQTIGEDQILSSAIHNNQSHTLSLALWQGFRWQADWLHRNDLISVPATMKVALSSISYHRVGNLIKDRNFDAMVAKKTRYQQYCKGVLHKTSTKQVRRKVPSWEEPFRPEHIKCHGNRHCIDQIRQKCLVHGLRVIGKVNYLSDCVFSINEPQTSKCWKFQYKSSNQRLCLDLKYHKCQKDLREKRSNWSVFKVSKKCQIRQKIEKCIIKHSKKRRKDSQSSKKWRRRVKSARKLCRQKVKKMLSNVRRKFNKKLP